MTNKNYSTPDCSISALEQLTVICGSLDFETGSLVNDSYDDDFFVTE